MKLYSLPFEPRNAVTFYLLSLIALAGTVACDLKAAALTPEQEIERLIDKCLFDKTCKRSFESFVNELLTIINKHRQYFLTKIPENILNDMIADFSAAKGTKNYALIISILIKYKEYKEIVPTSAIKKFSTIAAIRGLQFRLNPPPPPKKGKNHLADPIGRSMPL